jgi:putative Holliday junction resolvase
MKVLGLDLGDKTLGIAISDDIGMLARGLETYRFEDKAYHNALLHTIELVKKYKVETVVLGYPKNMDNSIGTQAQVCIDFKEKLEKTIDINVVLIDERLTSRMASNMMIEQNLKRKKRKKDIDKMAAVIILQSYLDRN